MQATFVLDFDFPDFLTRRSSLNCSRIEADPHPIAPPAPAPAATAAPAAVAVAPAGPVVAPAGKLFSNLPLLSRSSRHKAECWGA